MNSGDMQGGLLRIQQNIGQYICVRNSLMPGKEPHERINNKNNWISHRVVRIVPVPTSQTAKPHDTQKGLVSIVANNELQTQGYLDSYSTNVKH